jgi:hypothetical protein
MACVRNGWLPIANMMEEMRARRMIIRAIRLVIIWVSDLSLIAEF